MTSPSLYWDMNDVKWALCDLGEQEITLGFEELEAMWSWVHEHCIVYVLAHNSYNTTVPDKAAARADAELKTYNHKGVAHA